MNLFTPPLPSAARYVPGLFTEDESAALFDRLRPALPWHRPRLFLYGRWVNMPRAVCWFGPIAYRYSNHMHKPAPMPAEIETVCDRVYAATGLAFNAVLCNLYENGNDSVSWHADDDFTPGEHSAIASISFGAARRFDLRHKTGRPTHSIDLMPGSLLLMGSGMQSEWEHAVPKVAHAGERINLTFRCVGAT